MLPTFVRRATLEDAETVAARIRPADRDECMAATGLPPELVLPQYVREGRECYAAGLKLDDRAEILFGVDPVYGHDRIGIIWLVSTPRIEEQPVEFVVMTKNLLEEFHKDFDVLTNFMDERNERHIRWLKWMGFKFLRRVEKYGAESRPFIEFASVRIP
jgi:hypothetical protein